MAYEIIFKQRFVAELGQVLTYLEQEWNKNAAETFLKKLEHKLAAIKSNPQIGTPSQKISGVRGLLVTRHNRLFYTIQNNTIIVLSLFDTRRKRQKY